VHEDSEGFVVEAVVALQAFDGSTQPIQAPKQKRSITRIIDPLLNRCRNPRTLRHPICRAARPQPFGELREQVRLKAHARTWRSSPHRVASLPVQV